WLSPRYQHRHTVLIAAVFVAEEIDQIVLFQHYANEDVCGRRSRKQQMANSHRRHRPERDDQTEVEWVPHELVEQRSQKTWCRCRTAHEMAGHLMQPEQLEVVDQERAGQGEQPTCER